jgi:hypothetical protein
MPIEPVTPVGPFGPGGPNGPIGPWGPVINPEEHVNDAVCDNCAILVDAVLFPEFGANVPFGNIDLGGQQLILN